METQPQQCFVVTITCDLPSWGAFKQALVFKMAPTKADIMAAVLKQNAFYTDHAKVHDLLVQACDWLPDLSDSGNSGWSRTLHVGGYNRVEVQVRMNSEDWFDNVPVKAD